MKRRHHISLMTLICAFGLSSRIIRAESIMAPEQDQAGDWPSLHVMNHASRITYDGSGLKQYGRRNRNTDYVVLLHGLGRTPWSMVSIEFALKRQGYQVINVSYPSTRLPVQALANEWLGPLLDKRTPDRSVKVHFVAHSLGGIILRQYLSEHRIENLGRVVMLAPPNRGSELVDRLRNCFLFRLVTGPAGQQLGTDAGSLPHRLGPANHPLGIIAGDRSFNPCLSAWIPGPDDGKVSVQSTRLEGMRDFLVVHRSHTWMMWHKDVHTAIAHFLAYERF